MLLSNGNTSVLDSLSLSFPPFILVLDSSLAGGAAGSFHLDRHEYDTTTSDGLRLSTTISYSQGKQKYLWEG